MKPRQPRQQPRQQPRHKPSARAKTTPTTAKTITHGRERTQHHSAHITPLARIAWRGWRGLSGFKELQHFRRGFWRGFSILGVVFKVKQA